MMVNPTDGLVLPPPSPLESPSDEKGLSESHSPALQPAAQEESKDRVGRGEGRGRVEVGGRDAEGGVRLPREAEEVDDADPLPL